MSIQITYCRISIACGLDKEEVILNKSRRGQVSNKNGAQWFAGKIIGLCKCVNGEPGKITKIVDSSWTNQQLALSHSLCMHKSEQVKPTDSAYSLVYPHM